MTISQFRNSMGLLGTTEAAFLSNRIFHLMVKAKKGYA